MGARPVVRAGGDVVPRRLRVGSRPLIGYRFCPRVLHRISPMDKIIPISELQTQARRIIAGVKDAGDPVIITQRGRPAAMLVNYQDYEGVIATLEEMSEPDWRERLTDDEDRKSTRLK